ncbi:MAG: zinc ribbon domain-containing protein [Anaerolineae bacterium]|nr:zinc ribbon domain-containing protein [Anaerolineae bacterium]
MPLYEYQCKECGLRFERRQSFSEKPVKICPDCGGEVTRLIQPAGIIFKGSGFYVTDNRAKSSTTIPGARKDTTPSESTGSETPATHSTPKSSESKEAKT